MSDKAQTPLMEHNPNFQGDRVEIKVASNGYILIPLSHLRVGIYASFSALVNAIAHDLGLLKIGQSLTLEVKP